MSIFQSLSTYKESTHFKSYFPRWLEHSYYLLLRVFLWFFHWNSLGPVEILYGLGGTKMSVFHLLSNLLFNWIPFHKNRFLHKIDSVQFNAKGATNDSKSLFTIPKFNLHVDIQLLKVRNERRSLGFTVGHGQTKVNPGCKRAQEIKWKNTELSTSWNNIKIYLMLCAKQTWL
jgi:hypothetical protein